jgi:hypothetical protein
LFICAKDLFIAAMDGNGPDHLRPGQVGRTARSRIRPFPLCIIALSRDASCLHLSFNYSQSAFFGQVDKKPPHAANSWLATLRSLCQFALKRGYRRDDPAANIRLRAIKGDGFHTLSEDEIAKFEAHHPIGTKPRLAFATASEWVIASFRAKAPSISMT